MFVLKENLEQLDYQCYVVDLPLTFKSIPTCTAMFKEKFRALTAELTSEARINLVGHSTGGVIIRNFLATTNQQLTIDKVVLIATPNQGSQLANLAAKLSTLFVKVFKPINSLQQDNFKTLNLKVPNEIALGAIAGTKSNLVLGNLLAGANDGRIQVKEVKDKTLDDFTVLPYGHKEIHYQFQTAKVVDYFLKNGQFEN